MTVNPICEIVPMAVVKTCVTHRQLTEILQVCIGTPADECDVFRPGVCCGRLGQRNPRFDRYGASIIPGRHLPNNFYCRLGVVRLTALCYVYRGPFFCYILLLQLSRFVYTVVSFNWPAGCCGNILTCSLLR